MAKVFTIETKGKGDVWLEAHLPMTPYEMLDLLDKKGLTPDEIPTGEVCSCNVSMDASALLAGKQHDLYELNALARKLASMDDVQRIAFDGLVKMETDKMQGPVPLGRLIDLAYSVDCCDVHPGVATYKELGRFYIENDFVPKLGDLSEAGLEVLNYEKIGEEFCKMDGGVLVSGGYVLQTSDLVQVFHTLALKPQQPGYSILLEISNGHFNDPKYDNDKTAQLPLPASTQALDAALNAVGARSRGGVSLRCLDCRAPALIPAIGEGDNIAHINRLAGMLDSMDDKRLTKFKAVLEATEDYSVLGATHIATTLDDYLFTPQYLTAEDMARDYIRSSMGEPAASQLYPFVQLERYGKALMEDQECALTDYGMVSREDGQCLKTSLSPTGPVQGGMSMM